ncbi:UNVERIFIED_ORG: uncharacterized membrane protein YcaP (DUF421 family) [Bacillus sp. 1751]|nr:uncharacterized membrane protein YcaP (DUF421 family) [Bacillus sp. 1751]
MAEITLDVLVDETLLKEKLEENQKEIEEVRAQCSKVIVQQAQFLERKIEEVTPIMRFILEKGYYMSHPTLKFQSTRGAVLDYDSDNNKLYVYDVESAWIKEINMFKKDEAKTVLTENFVAQRNLDNAIAGVNYLLVIQDEIKKELLQEKAEREQWLKENE